MDQKRQKRSSDRLLKLKHISLGITRVNDQTPSLWRSEVCDLSNLRPSGPDDSGKDTGDVVHLERKMPKAGFVHLWLITRMRYPVFVNLQEGLFQVRKL